MSVTISIKDVTSDVAEKLIALAGKVPGIKSAYENDNRVIVTSNDRESKNLYIASAKDFLPNLKFWEY